jgi:hypothetical protein
MVVDQQSRPVVGARVTAWCDARCVQTTTDAQGRFRLTNFPAHGGFVFVDATGFRFHGEYTKCIDASVKIVLTRTSEPATKSMRTLPRAASIDDAAATARELIAPYASRFLDSENTSRRLWALGLMARMEPSQALQCVQETSFENPWFNDYVRRAVVKMLLKSSLDDALAVVNSMEAPGWRSVGYRDAADSLPATERAKKLALLAESLLHARGVEAPDKRLVNLASIAERYLDLEAKDQAISILREGEKIARTLPPKEWPGYARGAFAEEFSQIDLEAALALTHDLSDESAYDRHHGNIALEIAARRPADAQRVLGMVHQQSNRDRCSTGVCYRMARIDLARARQIAGAVVDPHRRAFALGMMAQALSASDKATAAELVGEAFSTLSDLVDGEQREQSSRHEPHGVAAALLPVVESIDPSLVPEYFWRVLSLRRDVTCGSETRVLGRYGEGDRMRLSDPVLAACLARYDRDVAWMVLRPPGDETLERGSREFPRFYLAALAILDPKAAVGLADGLPEDNEQTRRAKERAWSEVVWALTRTSQERWDSILEGQLYLWRIGQEDL